MISNVTVSKFNSGNCWNSGEITRVEKHCLNFRVFCHSFRCREYVDVRKNVKMNRPREGLRLYNNIKCSYHKTARL